MWEIWGHMRTSGSLPRDSGELTTLFSMITVIIMDLVLQGCLLIINRSSPFLIPTPEASLHVCT